MKGCLRFFHFHIFLTAKFGEIFLWVIATWPTSQNLGEKRKKHYWGGGFIKLGFIKPLNPTVEVKTHIGWELKACCRCLREVDMCSSSSSRALNGAYWSQSFCGDGREQQNSSRALNLWQDLDTKGYYYTQVSSAQQNPSSVHLLLQQELDKWAENTLNLEAESSSSSPTTIITSSPPKLHAIMFFGVSILWWVKGGDGDQP